LKKVIAAAGLSAKNSFDGTADKKSAAVKKVAGLVVRVHDAQLRGQLALLLGALGWPVAAMQMDMAAIKPMVETGYLKQTSLGCFL
jgi:hypothetical protein